MQPGAAIVQAVFQRNPLVTPPTGFGQIARTVTEQRVPVPTPGAPTAYLDIYTPDGAAQPRPVILTLFWTGTGDGLRHEYQFNFDLPQARTAFQRTLAFLAATTRS